MPVDVSASSSDPIGQVNHLRGLEDAVKIRTNGNPVVAVQAGELAVGGAGQVRRQAIRLARFEGVQQQARQHEVVRPVPMAGQPFMGRIAVVDLRKHDQPERIGNRGDPVQEFVDFRLDHEAGRAGLLDDVPDGVEPNHANAVIGERSQPTCDQGARRLAGDIEVDLLRPVGRPE